MEKVNEDTIREQMEDLLRSRHEAEAQAVAAAAPARFELAEGSSIKHVIAVISGKGGVGKSLVCGSLALELARLGKQVGILDADITGPSIPRMFGLKDERAQAAGELIVPPESSTGIKIMSTNLVLANESDPVLWRGPILAGALRQFWGEVIWGELDYLFIDMPPGTGDVALTIFQSLPVEGVVIVSSPQDLVHMVVGKAVKMAQMMEIPILGIVENMAWMKCPHCEEKLFPFGDSKLDEIAKTYDVLALDSLEIKPELAEACDAGNFEVALEQGSLPRSIEAVLASAEFIEAMRG